MRVPNPCDYDAVAFDCDGVLLDSNAMKIEAFRSTLRLHGYSDTIIEAFSTFQARSFGLSRHHHFARLTQGAYGPSPQVSIEDLLETFGRQTSLAYMTVAEAPGLASVLSRLAARVPLFVVSGSDQAELREVFQRRGLAGWFKGIHGSPNTKVENLNIVRDALGPSGARARRILFFGDAEADADAAAATACDFVFIAAMSTVRGRMTERAANEGFPVAESLSEYVAMAGVGA